MPQIQRQCVKRQIFAAQFPDHLQGSAEQRELLLSRQLVGLGTENLAIAAYVGNVIKVQVQIPALQSELFFGFEQVM